MGKFHKYLLGHKCVVFADNNPLCHLHSAKLGATKQEWAAQLAAFDFEIKYTDALSWQWDHLVEENSVIFHRNFTHDPASKGQCVKGWVQPNLPQPLAHTATFTESGLGLLSPTDVLLL